MSLSSLHCPVPDHADDDSQRHSDDPRLLELVREYCGRLEAGEAPSREDYVSRYPELAEAVQTCLDGLELIHHSAKRGRERSHGVVEALSITEPLGDFRILRQLGRGGMGVVYEAVQSSLGRRVALKVLPFAATLQPRQLQRFLNEAQAAAHLHHPHIVPVFAIGSDRGVHYYAMQLIEGLSLAELLFDLRRDAGWDSTSSAAGSSVHSPADAPEASSRDRLPETINALSSRISTQRSFGREEYSRTVARIGLQAAEALSYAHELGIIHRDIKPGNLLIDAHGEVWVTDFGLAQFRNGGELTQTGDFLGTLRYMSPEQMQGNHGLLDPRTDIYSLGATLYELATLHPLFDGLNRELILNHVLHVDPPAPRTRNPTISIELDTIIVKAISKSAGDRYATATALADDLRRFLNDQPILARRPTVIDRARKWGRRHPAAVVVAMLGLFTISVGLLIHNRLIAREQSRTEAALHREQARLIEAELSFRQAREAVDLLIQISEEELADKPPLQPIRKRLLLAALEYYEEFIAQRSNDAASTQELAAVESRVRGILRELSIVDGLFRVIPVTTTDVQRDLGVTPEQRKQLEQFQSDMESELRSALFSSAGMREERHRRFVAFAEQQSERLNAILSPSQQRRLKQISLQFQGLFAFQDSEVSETLQLTADQLRVLRDSEQTLFFSRVHFKPFEAGALGEFPGPPLPREGDERRMRDQMQNMYAVLTPEQLVRWRELTGPEFHGKRRMFPRLFRDDGPHRGDGGP